ncbi:MAG: hypothetical protein ACOH5I_00400 [Oligoflexus sp.]
MPAINFIMGIDQTGAQHPRRAQAAKPLPIALVFRQKDYWKVTVSQSDRPQPLQLNRINYDSLLHLQKSLQEREGPLIVAIDCVLGMPEAVTCPPSWGQGRSLMLKLFLEATHYHHKLKDSGEASYGLTVSRDFFRKLQFGDNENKNLPVGRLPQRWVESLLKANSVFRERPFQKNIQSGTFRIWAELGSSNHLDRIHMWPFDDIQRCQAGDIMLMECYPSHLWRADWGINRRNPMLLIERILNESNLPIQISEIDRQILENSIDHCDALVNALGFLLRWQADPTANLHPNIPKVMNKEGWILGAEAPKIKKPKKLVKQNCEGLVSH